MDEKTKRLIGWMNGKPQPPYTIELVPTNRCNFNCISCWRRSASKEKIKKAYAEELSDERLLQLIDEAAELGVKEIAFVGGGEPLSRNITLELMKKIRGYDIEGDLVTNGSLLTQSRIETIVGIGWTRVKFSIDGASSILQDKLRGKKCFHTIKRNIMLLSKIKKKKGTDRPKIGFNVVVSNQNYKDVPRIIKLAHEVGCNEILILPLTVFSEEGKKLKLSQEQIEEFKKIIKISIPKLKEYNIYSNIERFLDSHYISKTNSMHEVLMEEAEKEIKTKDKEQPCPVKSFKEDFKLAPCFEPWSHITIIPNGNVACCFNNYVWTTKVSVKDCSLKELWYGHYFDNYRKEVITRKLPKACATCCVWRVFDVQKIRNELKKQDDLNCKNLFGLIKWKKR